MRRRRALVWAVGIVLLAVLLAVGLAGKAGGGRAKLAPPLPRQDLVAPAVTLADLRGHPAFVTFWASWCGPCASEAPTLERFAQSLAGRARLIGVNVSDEVSPARAFIRKYHWTFTSLRDPEGQVGAAYGVKGPPITFVLDSRGRIRETLRGPQTVQTLAGALTQVIHD